MPAGTPLAPDQFLLSEEQTDRGPALRILTRRPPAGALALPPELEDAFLAIYGEGQP